MNERRVDSGKSIVDSQSAKAGSVSQPSAINYQLTARFQRNLPAVGSSFVLAVLVLIVLGWPIALRVASWCGPKGVELAQRYQPDRLSEEQFQPPSPRHWFGTDVHGRDLWSRAAYGARVSLLVGIVGAGVSLVIGVLWGAIAGYVGGRTDGVMMRLVDVFYSLPSIIFIIVVITTLDGVLKKWLAPTASTTLGPSARLLFLFVGLGAVSWLTMARIVRGQVLSLRRTPFVEASRALGAGPLRILASHILPNTLGVVIVYLTLTVPAIILYESFLSYLGLGIQPPMASLGSLIAEGADQINPIRVYWWLLVLPGGLLVTALLALNFIGDGLRDVWDVRSRGFNERRSF